MQRAGGHRRWPFAIAACVASVLSLGFALSAQAVAATTDRMSVASDGTQGNGDSDRAGISADGRYVAFESVASNLVPGDTNAASDIFVRDRNNGATQRVSLSGSGQQANGDSFGSAISADGRYVAVRSQASNLVSGDTNGVLDEFVYDRQSGAVEQVSVDSAGVQANGASGGASISADGRYVAFLSNASNLVSGDTNGNWDVFVYDRQTRTTQRVSVSSTGTQGNGDCDYPQISDDGRYVAFRSAASNLVPGDTNGAADIFVHDLQTGTTVRVSVGNSGAQANGESLGPTISGDGRFVAFRSAASNLVPGDTNGVSDVFLRDTQAATTARVSVASDGTQGNADSYGPALSSDGGFVVYRSDASNLVPGDTNGNDDIFSYDRQAGTTERVSVDSSGAQSNDSSFAPFTNSDGRFVIFWSRASNLVPGDTNGSHDVLLRDTATVTGPAAPTFTGTDPASPADNNSPKIKGSGPDGSTVNLYSTGDCSGTPAASGTAADFASPGLTVNVADDSSTTFHATATTNGATSACSPDSVTYVEDSPPSGGHITTNLPAFGLTTPFTVEWGGASDSGSVTGYTAYVRTAPYDGGFDQPVQFATSSGSGTGSSSYAGEPGHTYCFSVTATDDSGNTSSRSAETCTALPADDPDLAGTGWIRSTNQPGYYRGTSSTSSTKGATLTLPGVQAKQIALVATTCSNCGKVQVLLGSTSLKTVNLASRNGQTKQVIPVASFSTVQTGTVTLRLTTAGKRVIIDGLGVSRT
jgi:WD40-like Beta Propeller Repeat